MLDKIKKISSFHIILFTAIMLVGLFVAKGVTGFVMENSAEKKGSLKSYTLSADDFVWSGVRYKNNEIVTTDNDPQLLLEGRQAFTSVEFYMKSSVYPGEMEQQAMAYSVLKVLHGEVEAIRYPGKPVWEGFSFIDD